MRLKKGNKSNYEFDYMIVNTDIVCVQIACLPGKFPVSNRKILEKHLKNAVEEINSFTEVG